MWKHETYTMLNAENEYFSVKTANKIGCPSLSPALSKIFEKYQLGW